MRCVFLQKNFKDPLCITVLGEGSLELFIEVEYTYTPIYLGEFSQSGNIHIRST